MISHIFKIIWTERKVNFWILLELILVFTILWFCSEYIFVLGKHYMEPKGYDINNTYVVNFGMRKDIDTSQETEEDREFDIDRIYNLIKSYPGVESVVLTEGNYPYGPNWRTKSRFVVNKTDTLTEESRDVLERPVRSEYFDVFKINLVQGSYYRNEDAVNDETALVSPDYKNTFIDFPIADIRYLQGSFGDPENGFYYERERKVTGITNPIKYIDLEPYSSTFFYPIRLNRVKPTSGICIRVVPDADNGFADRFMKDMYQRLEVGPFFLTAITSMNDVRTNYMNNDSSYNNNLRSVSSIAFFLIVNMFLGIVGTFWFRVQSRRKDIGLRIALGSSKGMVRSIYMGEAFILLFIASVISTVLCINISLTGILSDIGIPSLNKDFFNLGETQYIINYLVTFFVLGLMALVAVWLPANRASNIQPTEALHDE